MAAIIIPSFGGEVPRTAPRLLDQIQASTAVNCRLERGALEALPGPAKVSALPVSAGSIFKHAVDGWLSWAGRVSVIKSAVLDMQGDKPLGHLFLTGDLPYPMQYLAGGERYRLGVPRPNVAPTVKVQRHMAYGTAQVYAFGVQDSSQAPPRYGAFEGDGIQGGIGEGSARVTVSGTGYDDGDLPATDDNTERSTAYCYTFVQCLADGIFQQESAPSPASDVVDINQGAGCEISGFVIPKLAGLQITHIRLYRTVSGEKSSEFHFVAEIKVNGSAAGLVYNDTIHDADISPDVLPTSMWDCIPDDARGLIKTDNGLYAAFRGNELLISEPFVAYAFPEAYRVSVEDTIVALAHTDGTIVVLTTGRPYLAAGSAPESLQITHLPIEQGCVSAESVASLAGGVVYASPDGLMLFSANEQTLISAQTFTRDQWQAMHPEKLMGTIHDGRYVGFFKGSNSGLLFSVGAKDIIRITLPDDWRVSAVYHHSEDDCVYIAANTAQGSAVYRWEAGSPLPYTWKSKPFFTSALTCPSALRVEGEQSFGNTVTVRLFGGTAQRARDTLRITDSRTRRVRPTRAEKEWAVELRGTARVYEVRLGAGIEGVEYGQ